MSVIKPEITSIINGVLTVTVTSVPAVEALFDQLLIFRASSVNGPFSQIDVIPLSGQTEYTYCDTNSDPTFYYKVQFFHSVSMISSAFSEVAQETGIFSPFTAPTSTATYPPEIALSSQDREIVESVRITLGDLGIIERDLFDAADPQSVNSCSLQLSVRS